MTSKLDAVNIVLKAIGEVKVNSLDTGLPDAAEAEAALDEATTDILSQGWHVNTDEALTMPRNVDNQILVADNVIRVDTTGTDARTNVTIRVDPNDNRRKLYDKKNQTFSFTKDLSCDVTYSFPFDDLTHELQQYIAAVAARRFQMSELSSVALDKDLARKEAEAWARFQDAESELEDANTLFDSPHCAAITGRNNPYRGT